MLLTKCAKVPKQGTEFSGGYDLCIDKDYVLQNGIYVPANGVCPMRGNFCPATFILDTGLALEIPNGYFGKIEDRSSWAVKGMRTGGGVIDSDYRGHVRVIMHNIFPHAVSYGYLPEKLEVGTAVAQIVFHKLPRVQPVETIKLGTTKRGVKGFGSTSLQ